MVEKVIKAKSHRPGPGLNLGKISGSTPSGSRLPRLSSTFHLLYSLFLVVLLLSSCATPGPTPSTQRPSVTHPGEQTYRVMGRTYNVMGTSKGFVQRGEASWYGKKFHGRKTSSGEVYDMEKFTAAHRTLPLGTYVKVKRTDGRGESVVVKINDRGPFVNDRIIDLSRAAARQLQMLDEGVAPVEITALGEEILRRGPREVTLRPRYDYDRGVFSVQVGAFTVRENARSLVRRMKNEHGTANLSLFDRGDANFFRVRVGRFSTREKAEEFRDKLIRSGEFDEAFVVAR